MAIQTKKKSNLGRYIVIALIAGIVVGQLVHMGVGNPERIKEIANKLDIVSSMFLRMLKMIIAPLVFTTLVAGIAKMGDSKSLGRLFFKSMFIFITGGFIALLLGIVLIEVFKPGVALHDVLASGLANIHQDPNLCTNCQMDLKKFLEGIIPSSMVQGFVENHILQVVVVAIFFGVAGVAIGEDVAPVFEFFDMVAKIIFKITGYIMNLAPFAVFSAVSSMVMSSGVKVISSYLIYLLEFYLGLAILWVLIIAIGTIIVGKPLFSLLRNLSSLFVLSFASSSSEVALPGVLVELEKFGVSRKISGFVIPMGYSFNLLASMLNCTFATMFIIQLYGYHPTLLQEVTMLLMLMLTSKGIAGVPRVSLVIVAATLAAFGYPEAGVLILFPVDGFLDMGRSATNVFANAMAAVFVDRWEKGHNHQ